MLTHAPDCAEMELLLQADLDGELDAVTAAVLTKHIAQCAHCAELQKQLLQLHQMLRDDSLRDHPLREKPSAEFTESLRQKLALNTSATVHAFELKKSSNAKKNIGLFSSGAALAASLFLAFSVNRSAAPEDALLDSVVTEHVQSLQADHLYDVVSTDRHTVKPWFNGKLDFAPPVVDFADNGFALAGGRLAYLDGHNVAALVYRHGPHPINVFVWPSAENTNAAADCSRKSGYNVCKWRKNTMNYWVVSDMAQDEMQKFVALWE